MKYNLSSFCEFDKYAVQSYCAIHDTDERLNLEDITKADETKVPHFNAICGGSPCQDFSISGKLSGAVWTCRSCRQAYNPLEVHYSRRDRCPNCNSEDLDKSRSSLLVEWLRMIRENRPDWGIYENVKNIVGKKFLHSTFRLFEQELQEYGYHTYWAVLNSKDFGIPQNRERVYLILIKNKLDNEKFCFPKPLNVCKSLNDILEEAVDERYYLPEEKVQKLISDMEGRDALLFEPDEEILKEYENELNLKKIKLRAEEYLHSGRVYLREGCYHALVKISEKNKQPKIVKAGRIGSGFTSGRVYSSFGICGTLMAGHNQPKIIEKASGSIKCQESNGKDTTHSLTTVSKDEVVLVRQATKKGYIECMKNGVIRVSYPKSKTKRGRVQGHGMICPTLLTSNDICRLESLIQIRRLTPLECFRLMGFSDEDFWKAKQAGVSDSQLYKQAGNAIVVDVLFYIFQELYEAMPYLFQDVQLASFFSGIGAFEKALERLEKVVN